MNNLTELFVLCWLFLAIVLGKCVLKIGGCILYIIWQVVQLVFGFCAVLLGGVKIFCGAIKILLVCLIYFVLLMYKVLKIFIKYFT